MTENDRAQRSRQEGHREGGEGLKEGDRGGGAREEDVREYECGGGPVDPEVVPLQKGAGERCEGSPPRGDCRGGGTGGCGHRCRPAFVSLRATICDDRRAGCVDCDPSDIKNRDFFRQHSDRKLPYWVCVVIGARSEERRVGKECRARWAAWR